MWALFVCQEEMVNGCMHCKCTAAIPSTHEQQVSMPHIMVYI